MKPEEIDKKLHDYYSQIKDLDNKIAPPFEKIVTGNSYKRSNKSIPIYLKVAASIILIGSLSILAYLVSKKFEYKPVVNANTEVMAISDLLSEPEYIWDWESPTRHFLDIKTEINLETQNNN